MVFPFHGPVSTNADDLAKEIERLRKDLVTVAAKLGRAEQTDLWPFLFDRLGNSGQIIQSFGGKPTWSGVVSTLITAGSSGQLLQSTGGLASWVDSTNVPGIIDGSTVGTSGQILQTSGGVATWVDQSDLTGTPDPSTGHISTIGSSGQVLQTTGGAATWVDSTTIPGTIGTTVGSSGQVLQTTGGAATWVDSTSVGGGGIDTTVGSSGQVLQTSGGVATWVDSTTIPGTIGSTIGTSGQILESTGGVATWVDNTGGGGASTLAARVELTANESISSNHDTPVPWDVAIYDHGGFWSSAAPTRLTVPEDGVYDFGANIYWEHSTIAQTILSVWANGASTSRLAMVRNVSSAQEGLNIAGQAEFSSGEYIECIVWQGLSGTQQLDIATWHAHLNNFWIAKRF